MQNKKKETYIAPESDAVELKLEAIIAASGDPDVNVLDLGDPFGNTPEEVEW